MSAFERSSPVDVRPERAARGTAASMNGNAKARVEGQADGDTRASGEARATGEGRAGDETRASDAGAARTALAKGLDLLTVIAERGVDGMGLSAAARRADMHVATAHRLLATLTETGYVSFDPYSKRYHLGIMPYEIVGRAGEDVAFVQLRRRMRCALRSSEADVGGIFCLSVPTRGEALCIDVVEAGWDIKVSTLKVGSRRPLGAGGASLALLAALPEAERETVLTRERERYTKYGDLTADVVRAAIARFPEDGYVVNEAVIIPDIAAIGIPLFEGGRCVAAMSVTNVQSRLARQRESVVAAMRAVAERAGFTLPRIA
ncbi:IclR-family regulatory protein [Stappia sp. 22II-S9-Z10]|nr:IclR-family regulatory protein [Stappia sp. 22II-S9-Z10]